MLWDVIVGVKEWQKMVGRCWKWIGGIAFVKIYTDPTAWVEVGSVISMIDSRRA